MPARTKKGGKTPEVPHRVPMPTLQELTLEHSRRLSEIYRTRDVQLAEAFSARDARLQQLPGAAKLLQKYREALAEARHRQVAAAARAGAVRAAAFAEAGDHRSDVLHDADRARQDMDLKALADRRRDEEAVEETFREAMQKARELPDAARSRAVQDADRDRRSAENAARRGHDEALTASQRRFRDSIEDAMTTERRHGRDGDRAYYDALRLGDAAMRAAAEAAEDNLLTSLMGLEGAAEILRQWRLQSAAITIAASKAEQEEFSRFRHELSTLTFR